jgi:hypothetical protein
MKRKLFISLLIISILSLTAAFATVRPLSIIGETSPYYSPDTITIAIGDSLLITNNDSMPHTVTSDSTGLFDTGSIGAGGTAILTFNTAGDFPYHCTLHPAMIGMVKVVPAAGGVELENASIEIAITTSMMSSAISGVNTQSLIPTLLAIDTDNSLLIYNDPSSGLGLVGTFLKFGLSGSTTGFTFGLESTAVLQGQYNSGGTLDIDPDGMSVASDGTVIFGDHDPSTFPNDQFIGLGGRTLGTSTAFNISTSNTEGLTEFALAPGDIMYFPTEASFGGGDNIKSIAYPAGTTATLITLTDITSFTGRAGYGAGPITYDSLNNRLLFSDNARFGGSDAILSYPLPSGPLSYAVTSAAFGNDPDISNMRADAYGNLYTWNEPPSGVTRFAFIKSDGSVFDYTETAVNALLGKSNFDTGDEGGITVTEDVNGNIVAFFGNAFGTPAGDIIAFRFPKSDPPIAVSPGVAINLNPSGIQGFSVSNGTPPYTWSLVTSAANQGSLDTTGGSSVVFTAGSATGTLRVKVTDSASIEALSGLITVSPTSAPLFMEERNLTLIRKD